MKLPKTFEFPFLATLLLLYFLFDAQDLGLLPVPHSYLIFGLTILSAYKLYIARHWNYECFIFSVLLSGAATIAFIASGTPSAFMYALPLLLLVALYNDAGLSNTIRQSNLYSSWIVLVLIIAGLSTLPFLITHDGARKSLPWIGNPNYTSIFYLGWFLSIYFALKFVNSKVLYFVGKVTSIAIILGVVFLTQSRSLLLAIIIFWVVSLLGKLEYSRTQRAGVICILLLSVFSQLILYYIFGLVTISQGRSGTLIDIFDESNWRRVSAFYQSFMIVISNTNFIFGGLGGSENVLYEFGKILDHVPHNWFMLMVISDGFVFTLLVFSILFRAAMKINERHLPAYSAILVLATIIGRTPLFAPLCLYTIVALVTNVKAKSRNE